MIPFKFPTLPRRTYYKIEVLVPIVTKVVHRMINAESDFAVTNMPSQERASVKKIEDDTPTGNLGVVITPPVVLPRNPLPAFWKRFTDRTNQYLRTAHAFAARHRSLRICTTPLLVLEQPGFSILRMRPSWETPLKRPPSVQASIRPMASRMWRRRSATVGRAIRRSRSDPGRCPFETRAADPPRSPRRCPGRGVLRARPGPRRGRTATTCGRAQSR